MGSSLTADIFLSVDGWAGSDELPGYFGYRGPEFKEPIAADLAAPRASSLPAPRAGGYPSFGYCAR